MSDLIALIILICSALYFGNKAHHQICAHDPKNYPVSCSRSE